MSEDMLTPFFIFLRNPKPELYSIHFDNLNPKRERERDMHSKWGKKLSKQNKKKKINWDFKKKIRTEKKKKNTFLVTKFFLEASREDFFLFNF